MKIGKLKPGNHKKEPNERTIADLDAEFGIVQSDHFHGGDDLPGLLDLSGDDKMKVGLFHQVLHVLLRLNHDRLFHTCKQDKSTTVLLTIMNRIRILFEKKEDRLRPLSLGSMVTVGSLSMNSALLTPV